MALQQQKVPVQFRGLETKLDPRQAVIGDVVLLENVRFDAPPKWQKRFGYERLAKAPSAVQAAAFRDELLVGTGYRLQSLGSNGLSDKGALAAVAVETSSVVGSAYGLALPSSAIHPNGTALHTWTQSTGSGGQARCYSVVDTLTGKTLAAGSFTTNYPLRTLVAGNYLVVIGSTTQYSATTGTLAYWYVDVAAPTTMVFGGSISAGDLVVNAGQVNFDACSASSTVYVTYQATAGLVARSFVVAGSVSGATTIAAGAAPVCTTIFPGTTGLLWVLYATATNVYRVRITTALAVSIASASVAVQAGVVNVTGAAFPGATGSIQYFYEVAATSPGDHRIEYGNILDTGTVNATGVLVRSLGLASKVFTNGVFLHFLAAHESTLQSGYFLYSVGTPSGYGGPTQTVAARFASGIGSGLTVLLSDVSSGFGTGTRFALPVVQADRSGAVGGEVFAQAGIHLAQLVFGQAPFSQEMGGGTLFSGGMASLYDGTSVAEHGFHLYPEGVVVSPSSTAPATGPTLTSATGSGTSGFLAPGNYYFRVSAVFADGSESLASAEQMGTVAAGPSTGIVTLVWTAVGSATGYRIYVGTDSGVYSQYFNWSGSTTTVYSGGEYCYLTPAGSPLIGSTTPGTFQVCATYEWVDAHGVVHSSAPSPAVEVVINQYGYSFDYSVPTLRVTDKLTPVLVVIWRTAANQSVFFRVTPPPAYAYAGSGAWPLYNDKTVDAVTYAAEKIPEATLVGNQQLVYNPLNSLAEVPPLPVDSIKFVTRYRNRVVAIPSENPGQIYFSKVVLPGVPIEFNPQQLYQSVQGGGPTLIGAIEMDDKLILFSEDRIYFMAGDGPAANGTGSDYANPYRIPSDVGCVNARSLVLTPQGVLFQSWKGIYLLGRDLSVSYFGSAVESFGTTPVTSANTLPDSQRTVLTLNSGVALVYDSFVQKWSVWTNYNAADAFSFGGKFTHVRPDGSINREDQTRFTDQEAAGITAVLIKFTTSWLSFAGLNGFQRVWRFSIRGDYKSPHSLKVQVAFDDDPTIVQSITFDTAAYFGVATFKPYEFLVKLSKQKCSSLQVTITETEPSGQEGEGFALSGLTFLAGLLPGLHKVPAGRTIS